MTELLTAAQMRAVEAAAIASGEVTGLDLMERAGRGVVDAIFTEWPELQAASHRAVVLCGPGNNGGDGFVVARMLKDWGWKVEAFLYGDPAKMPPDAKANYERWLGMGEVVQLNGSAATERFVEAASEIPELLQDPESDSKPLPFILVDALFGIGLSRPITGLDNIVRHWDYVTNFRDLIDARIVAIDICSGLDADTGDIVDGPGLSGTRVLPADLTVTFHRLKIGHQCGHDSHVCGKVVVVDIGL